MTYYVLIEWDVKLYTHSLFCRVPLGRSFRVLICGKEPGQTEKFWAKIWRLSERNFQDIKFWYGVFVELCLI